jgi:hypothetical protein
MCLFATMLLFGPRIAGIFWWIVSPGRWDAAFNDNWFWPVLGLIFLPLTTLMWVLVCPTGNPNGFDWFWLALAVFGDIASYGSSGYTNRERVPGYSSY